jgi:hypothetical protein
LSLLSSLGNLSLRLFNGHLGMVDLARLAAGWSSNRDLDIGDGLLFVALDAQGTLALFDLLLEQESGLDRGARERSLSFKSDLATNLTARQVGVFT